MLPDLWRMADRRARVGGLAAGAPDMPDAGLRELRAGVEHHLEIDRWFHHTPELTEGERASAERLRTSRASAPRLGLFAHIVWEMALDGALVRRVGLAAMLELLRRGFQATEGARSPLARALGVTRLLTRPEELDAFDLRMQRIEREIAKGPWIQSYQDGPGLAVCLAGVRSRLGMPPFEQDDAARLGEALDEVASEAQGSLDALFARRGSGGSARAGRAPDSARR